ncbi:uncharacterized protein MELLADRAFT_92871 [Melampsora larici-populina 98AG31]|uniref:Uncharacterized protein n=1 Tax=Melampsora larici-populina (strain 98AG31 / pathotype 3-4-7) TaxID=747676 RepID=F4S329_MELLP|nr:uncharacterized protein MELLADRAFT_92871 [Melampsora larici-populina 98AG31]EGG00907.1 hypothetical protein MELLADRAFT_92871 [Melampsora larici-populina 98AG31]
MIGVTQEETPKEQYMSVMVSLLSSRQEISSLRSEINEMKTTMETSTSSRLSFDNENPELRKYIKLVAIQNVMSGDVQGYTATKDRLGDGDPLPLSLYAKVMASISSILSKPKKWKKRLLPAGYGKNPDTRCAQAFHNLVNNILKEARKDFDSLLFTNIHFPERAGTASTAKIFEKQHTLVGGKVLVREEILKRVTPLERSRYAWLRLQGCHWGLGDSTEYGKKHFWAVVDEKLEFLRSQSTRYRYAYFFLCLQFDFDLFKGKKTIEEIKETTGTDFSLPGETAINDTISELNETYGDRVPERETAYENPEAA